MRLFLILASSGAMAIFGIGAYRCTHNTDVFFLHSTSELGSRYAGPRSFRGSLPVDRMPVASGNMERLGGLFDGFYVVKDGATDCSFIAAFMLMLQRDPMYPSRILRETPDGFSVHFPAVPTPVMVTRGTLRAYQDNWTRTREGYRRLWGGHIPGGLHLLRCAYYVYQTQTGIRGGKGAVPYGGIPARDLIVLSGARVSYSLSARCADQAEVASFKSCPGVPSETRLLDDAVTFVSSVNGPSRRTYNPLEWVGDPDTHLIVVSSSTDVPWYSGPSIVSNHAYYYLGKTPAGDYVLGNSYQTRRPLVVTPGQFQAYFRAIDFVDLHGGARRSQDGQEAR